jgi:hypothetical protein
MNGSVKISLAGEHVPMLCIQGNQQKYFEIIGTYTLEFELDLVRTTQIILEQTTSRPGFFYISQVSLGAIDITHVMHHHDICRTLDRVTGQEIGKFVPNVGSPDQLIITFGPDIYKILQRYASCLRVL